MYLKKAAGTRDIEYKQLRAVLCAAYEFRDGGGGQGVDLWKR
jgi:hypothetical protein